MSKLSKTATRIREYPDTLKLTEYLGTQVLMSNTHEVGQRVSTRVPGRDNPIYIDNSTCGRRGKRKR